MKLEQAFEVTAPLERVWDALIDVEKVAPCLPGASVTGRNDDGSYSGAFAVKIGPTTASYTGRLEMESVDENAHTAVMQANGTDKRGQGGARATITSVLKPIDGGGTKVEVVTDYHITGRLARFGRGGMIEDISERLLKQFAAALQASLAGAEAMPQAGEERAAEQPAAEEPAAEAPAAEQPIAEEPAAGATPAAPTVAATRWTVQPGNGNAASEPEPRSEPAHSAAAPEPAPPPEPAAAAAPPESVPSPEPPPAAEPIQAHALLAPVIWGRIRRNPAPLVGGVVAILLLRHFRRRRARGSD
jgi:carbon monoxide dehydrogenase subunit G